MSRRASTFFINQATSSIYDSDYQAVLTYATNQGYTLPSDAQKTIQNQLVLDLKSNGIWAEEAVIYSPLNDGSEQFGALNWKNPAVKALTRTNASWSRLKGYVFNADGYVDTNSTPSDFAYNNAGFAIHSSDHIYVSGAALMGAGAGTVGSNTPPQIKALTQFSHIYPNCYTAQGGTVINSYSNFNGYLHLRNKYYVPAETLGVKISIDYNFKVAATAASAPTDMALAQNIYFGAYNYNGTATSFIKANVQFYSAGTAQDALAQIKSSLIKTYVSNMNATYTTYPSVLNTNTLMWLDGADNTTITEDGGTVVSEWRDKLGSANKLSQSVVANRPLHTSGAIALDGTDDFMTTGAQTINTPITIYMVLTGTELLQYDYIWQGNTTNYRFLLNTAAATNNWQLVMGSAISFNTTEFRNKKFVLRMELNGTATKVFFDNTSVYSGTTTGTSLDGFTIGSNTSARCGIIKYYDIIVRTVVDNAVDAQDIYWYLKAKNGL